VRLIGTHLEILLDAKRNMGKASRQLQERHPQRDVSYKKQNKNPNVPMLRDAGDALRAPGTTT